MKTTIVLTRGSDWGTNRVYDTSVWGPEVTNEQADELAQLCLDRFQKLAAETSAYWLPQTSEVIGYANETVTTEQLEKWREQAIEEVWQAVLGESDDAELSRQVAALFPDTP